MCQKTNTAQELPAGKPSKMNSSSPESTKKSRTYGVMMAFTAVLVWGVLMILLKVASNNLSPVLVVWVRFTIAFPLLFSLLKLGKMEPTRIFRAPPILAFVAALMLASNYYFFLKGIALTGPSDAGMLIQTAPIMLALIGVIILGERFSFRQCIGLAIALGGLALFYYERRVYTIANEHHILGCILTLIAALSWAIFSTIQKRLSQYWSPQYTNLLAFGVSSLLFAVIVPWSEFSQITFEIALVLLTLGLITVCGYGALGEALKAIPASLVSVIITLYPLITLVVMNILSRLQVSWIEPEWVSTLGYVGAVAALIGVMLVVFRPGEEG